VVSGGEEFCGEPLFSHPGMRDRVFGFIVTFIPSSLGILEFAHL